MSEFLKEYQLYSDMSRLNNQTYFASDFDVPDVTDFLAALADPADLAFSAKTFKIYLYNLCKGKEKSVYVQLKWLFCLHRAMEGVTSTLVLERIYDVLGRMEIPVGGGQIEQFLGEGMLQPYIHLLAKHCLIRIHQRDQTNAHPQEKENSPTRPYSHLAYMKYNLLRYAAAELLPTTIEMLGFFRAHYPLLAKIAPFLHRILAALLQSVRAHRKSERLPISEEEISSLQRQVGELDEEDSPDPSYLDVQPTELSSKLCFFLGSANKIHQDQEEKQSVMMNQQF